MRRSVFVALAAVVVASTPLSAQDAGLPADSMEIGRKYTQWFLAYEADSLWSVFTPEYRERNGDVDRVVEMMDVLAMNAGTEIEVLEERYVTRNGRRQFWHTGRFSDIQEPIQIRWVITPEGQIAGAGINPVSQAPPVDPE